MRAVGDAGGGQLGQAERIAVAATAGAISSAVSAPAELHMIQQQRTGALPRVPTPSPLLALAVLAAQWQPRYGCAPVSRGEGKGTRVNRISGRKGIT